MAKIKRAGLNFLNFFKAEEILPSEFKEHHELEDYSRIKDTEFYIHF